MKAVKYLLFGFLGLAILAVLGLGAALMIVDGQFVKTRLERAMKEKNRTLLIEGVPGVRLFPVAGIALGKTSLSEPGGGGAFVALDSAEVAVRVLPLLSGEVAIETLKLSGLKLNVVRRKDGSMNFADLAGPEERDKKPARRPVLRIAEVDIGKVQVAFRDEASGQEMSVAELTLKTGRLDGQTPGDLSLALRVVGKRPEVDLRAQAAGALSFNLGRNEFAFDKFSAQLKGRFDQETIAAEFSAPKVSVTPARSSGSDIKGSVQVKGPQRSFDISYTLSLAGPPLAVDLTARLDESTIKAKVALPDLAPLKMDFDVNVDRINLDRYLPPEHKGARTDEPLDFSVLKGKHVTGKFAVGALTVRRAKLENVKAEIKLEGGKLAIAPHSANLYGGTVTGSASADADGNRIHAKEEAQNIAVGALLRDVAQKDLLEGRGNLSLDVQSAGTTVPAMKKALAGSAHVAMKDGAIKGINLAAGARNLKSAVGIKQGGSDASQKTDFSDMSASFNIKNGVARNDDLKASSPFLRLAGAGNVDIGNNSIDYLAKATLAATTKGQGGRDVANVAGVTVPVKLSGSLDNPQWHVDYTGLLGGAAGGIAETMKKGGGGVKDAAGGVTDAVRGLFKRK